MCDYCEKEKAKGATYGVICPKKAGAFMGSIIAKRIKGESLTSKEEEIFKLACKIFDPTFHGVHVGEIPEKGILVTSFVKTEEE